MICNCLHKKSKHIAYEGACLQCGCQGYDSYFSILIGTTMLALVGVVAIYYYATHPWLEKMLVGFYG